MTNLHRFDLTALLVLNLLMMLVDRKDLADNNRMEHFLRRLKTTVLIISTLL